MAARIITIIGVFAMGCVVAHHVPLLPNGGILKFGVPWFFFASGFWMGGKFLAAGIDVMEIWNREIKKRFRTLLLPYFIWNMMWFPVLFAANWIGWRYCGVERIVDGSADSIIRYLGFSIWRMPALVPTWFLRSLFVACVIVGLVWTGFGKCGNSGRSTWIVRMVMAAVVFWAIEFTLEKYDPVGVWWKGFLCFGIPVYGMACFATGGAVAAMMRSRPESGGGIVSMIRRQMMPVFLLHVPVILMISWILRALGKMVFLADPLANVFLGIVGVTGAIAIGEMMRAFMPRVTYVLFGGR